MRAAKQATDNKHTQEQTTALLNDPMGHENVASYLYQQTHIKSCMFCAVAAVAMQVFNNLLLLQEIVAAAAVQSACVHAISLR
jgi:hypothetical protein